MPGFFRARDGSTPPTSMQPQPAGPGNLGNSMPGLNPNLQHHHPIAFAYNQNPASLAHAAELNQLSQRLKVVQSQTQPLTDGLNGRSPLPAMPHPYTTLAPGAMPQHQQQHRIHPVSAASGMQLGAGGRLFHPPTHPYPHPHPMSRPPSGSPSGTAATVTPPHAAAMYQAPAAQTMSQTDLDSLLNDGRQARARASTIPQAFASTPQRPRSGSMNASFRPFAHAGTGAMRTSPGSTSESSDTMSHAFQTRLEALKSDLLSPPTSSPAAGQQRPFSVRQNSGLGGGLHDPFMGAAAGMMSPVAGSSFSASSNGYSEYGLTSPSNGLPPLTPTAFQQYQARPVDPFAREPFQFPTPLNSMHFPGMEQDAMPGFTNRGFPNVAAQGACMPSMMLPPMPMSPNPALYGL